MIPRIARSLIAAGALLAVSGTSHATSMSCAQAAAAAEAGASLPPGLLLAIGQVESGRTDAMGKRSPWPWTINAAGTGRFFDSAEDAILAVRSLRASGLASIDIGCFQINLFHHPNAFADLASGFDPLTNALAAARFLVSLHEEFGTWEPAIAAYHSRLDTQGIPYRDRVLAVWRGTPVPSIIIVAGVRIWGPDGEIGVPAGLSSWSPRPAAPRSHLPRVITVSFR